MTNATLEAVVCAPSVAVCDPPEHRGAPWVVLRRLPEIDALAGGLVVSWHSNIASVQSRRCHRICYEKPITVTPLDHRSELPTGDSFLVRGRDISLSGLSFIHRDPLAARKVAVTFTVDDWQFESVVTRLRWCRFRRDGLYQSGGQFLRVLAAH